MLGLARSKLEGVVFTCTLFSVDVSDLHKSEASKVRRAVLKVKTGAPPVLLSVLLEEGGI